MVAAASIGVEQPCRQSPAEQAHVVVLLGGTPLYQGQPRPGRLLPPRSLGKALRQLLKSCESRVREQLKALPPGRPAQAEALVAAYKHWEHRVRTRHLTPHHLRAPRPITSRPSRCQRRAPATSPPTGRTLKRHRARLPPAH